MRHCLPLVFVISACSTTGGNRLQPGDVVVVELRALTKRVEQLEADVALLNSTPRDSLGPCKPDDPYCCDEQTHDCD